jgi:hypothetical protein
MSMGSVKDEYRMTRVSISQRRNYRSNTSCKVES